MVSTIRYIFLFSLVVLTACEKNEFDLDFTLQKDITDNYNVTYYASAPQGGATVQAVASVRDGVCELKGSTILPTLIYVTNRKSLLPLVVYAEKGNKIKISGDDKDPLTWSVEGNDINDSITIWRKNNREILTDCVPDSVNRIVENYVEENPGSRMAAILMLSYFDRKIDERRYVELMSSLRGEAKNPALLSLAARSDQLYHAYSYPAKLKSMVMRSINKSGDTLKIDNKNPLFIFFWDTGFSERGEVIDSIKILEKEFPDSVRIIADICFEGDSVAWRNAIRRDSLNKDMKRFWTPYGLTDYTIMKMKVATTPYFIVFDKDGEQTYRGGDIKEAIEEYRHLQTL